MRNFSKSAGKSEEIGNFFLSLSSLMHRLESANIGVMVPEIEKENGKKYLKRNTYKGVKSQMDFKLNKHGSRG